MIDRKNILHFSRPQARRIMSLSLSLYVIVMHKCMARYLKGPSANSFKSDRASSLTGFITNSLFQSKITFPCKKWQPNLMERHTFSLIIPRSMLFHILLYFFFHYFSFFAFIFRCAIAPLWEALSVGRSVGWSVGWSVGRSRSSWKSLKEAKITGNDSELW